MASNNELSTDMDYQNTSLPISGNSTPERPTGQTPCAKLEATKADIGRYTLIVQGYENMITTLKQSNAQDEHDPTFVEMVKQCTHYEDLLDKAVSEFGTLPYCDTPGCPVHETPTSSPIKSQSTKRKEEDGFTTPPPGKISKNNLTYKEKFKINLQNRFNNLQPKDTKAAGPSRNNTTLMPKANHPGAKNLPPPVFLKYTKNHRLQMKTLNDIYPELRGKLTGEYIKLLTDTDEDRRELISKLKELEFQFYAIKPKAERPIKVVIKGLPRNSNPKDIENDLMELGFTVEKVSQLIGRISKQPLPIFLVSLPRNIFNAKIFELKKVSFMNVTVDGYDGKRITQCYSCKRFQHTAENCHITPRCLKCGDAHQTRDCEIERVEKPFCINCETYGHMANYSGCPKFPKPRKGTHEKTNTYTNTVNSIVRPGTSYSQAASTFNSSKTQQMAPQVKGNPAALVTNQAN
ncbi:nucleic-acid-binding protein from transposon X-element [Trichonephila clavipes]|uniref:Nucleic-acid-binding protein from transposon X-element n=1 Tax=Trichonephila clavipes TaxID=2585209 RepID=A0A8X6RXA3_TRICX|nr:nucleic-acid-binding protein from transposon X-element [Trichonephila clavipes]